MAVKVQKGAVNPLSRACSCFVSIDPRHLGKKTSLVTKSGKQSSLSNLSHNIALIESPLETFSLKWD